MLKHVVSPILVITCIVLGPWLGYQWAGNIVLFVAVMDVVGVVCLKDEDVVAMYERRLKAREVTPWWFFTLHGTASTLLLVAAGWFWSATAFAFGFASCHKGRKEAEERAAKSVEPCHS